MAAKKKNNFFDKILTQNERVVAVDVGSRYVKIAIIHRKKDEIETTVLDAEPIPYLSARGDITPEQVAAALSTVLERNNIKNASFISLLPLEFVSVKRFEVPSVSAEQIKQIVPFEAEKHLPFSVDRAVIDFDFMPLDSDNENQSPELNDELDEPTSEKAKEAKKAAETLEASGKKSIVTLAAVRRAVIPKFLELCNVKGCRQSAIDVNAFALYNSLIFSLKNETSNPDDGDMVAINIGARRTEMLIISAKNQELLFTRSINFGGDNITDAIATKLNISFEEAEKVKCENRDGVAEKIIKDEDVFAQLISQIEKSLRYVIKIGLSEKQNVLWLSGGTTALPGGIEYLEKKLSVTTRIFNPLPFVNAENKKFPPQIFAEVIGGALRLINELKIKVDLLPVDITKLQQIAIRKKRFIQLGIAVAGIVTILLFIFGFKILFTNLERRRLKAEYLRVTPEASKVDLLEKRNETLRIAVDKMEGLTDRKTSWTEVLKIIADSMSSNIWVNKISVDKKNYLTIDAYAIGMDYIAFKNKLNSSIRFDEVQIVTSQKDRSGKFNSFKLRCKVVPDYKYEEEFNKLRKELMEKLRALNPETTEKSENINSTNLPTETIEIKTDGKTTNSPVSVTGNVVSNVPPLTPPKKKVIFVPKPKEKYVPPPPVKKATVVKPAKAADKKILKKDDLQNVNKNLDKFPPKLRKLMLENKNKAEALKKSNK